MRRTSACNDKPRNADPYSFVLQFQPTEIDDLVSRRLTSVQQDMAFQAGSRIANGNYSRDNLNVIVAWKMEGVHLTRVVSYLGQNTDADIDHALRFAIAANTERSAIEILDRLHGVGVPVASAVLTTINPEKYTIIDIYALRSLGIWDGPTDKVDYYLAYLQKCRELAQQFKMSLRTLDHDEAGMARSRWPQISSGQRCPRRQGWEGENGISCTGCAFQHGPRQRGKPQRTAGM